MYGYDDADLPQQSRESSDNKFFNPLNTPKATWPFSLKRGASKEVIFPCIGKAGFTQEQLDTLTAIGIELRPLKAKRFNGFNLKIMDKMVDGRGLTSNPLIRLRYLRALGLWDLVAATIAEYPDDNLMFKWILSDNPDVDDMITRCNIDATNPVYAKDLRDIFIPTGRMVFPNPAPQRAGLAASIKPTSNVMVLSVEPYVSAKGTVIEHPVTQLNISSNEKIILVALNGFVKANKKSGTKNKYPTFTAKRGTDPKEKEPSSGGTWEYENTIDFEDPTDKLAAKLLSNGTFVKLTADWLRERLTANNCYYLLAYGLRSWNPPSKKGDALGSLDIDKMIEDIMSHFTEDTYIPVIPDMLITILPYTESQSEPILGDALADIDVAHEDLSVSVNDEDIPF